MDEDLPENEIKNSIKEFKNDFSLMKKAPRDW